MSELKRKIMKNKTIKLFLRMAIAAGFLSAVADRFGYWSKDLSVWGNWDAFLDYTQFINPWMPASMIPTVGIAVTVAEIVFAFFLIIGLRTELTAKLSGWLLLIFALSMTFSTNIKGALDFSVFTASAAAFALGCMTEKYFEVDTVIAKSKKR